MVCVSGPRHTCYKSTCRFRCKNIITSCLTASIIKITPVERTLAIKAAKTLGLEVAGVDIIRSKKDPLLLEVNSSPGLEGIETATGKDVAGMMISAIEKEPGWKIKIFTKDGK